MTQFPYKLISSLCVIMYGFSRHKYVCRSLYDQITNSNFFFALLQLRVSSILSNSPYILLLDCDMYCNDPMSARRAMCFYLDPKISPSLGWVQYPQKFHNISETDIYNSQMREIWSVSLSINLHMKYLICFLLKVFS